MTAQWKKIKFIVTVALALIVCLSGCEQNRVNSSSDVLPENTPLVALSTSDMYEDGEIFVSVPESVREDFLTCISNSNIPDARKGEQAVSIHDEGWEKSPIIYLASDTDEKIYLYGYNNPDYPGYGLIIDSGEEQTIYPISCYYMTNTTLLPDIKTINEELVAIILHSVNGTGVNVDDLYILCKGKDIEPYHLKISSLVESLNQSVYMDINSEEENIRIYWDGTLIAEDGYTVLGLEPETNVEIDSFYVGNQITYEIEGSSGIRLNFTPQLYTSDAAGVANLDHIGCLQAPIRFIFDSNGAIEGYVIDTPSAIMF